MWGFLDLSLPTYWRDSDVILRNSPSIAFAHNFGMRWAVFHSSGNQGTQGVTVMVNHDVFYHFLFRLHCWEKVYNLPRGLLCGQLQNLIDSSTDALISTITPLVIARLISVTLFIFRGAWRSHNASSLRLSSSNDPAVYSHAANVNAHDVSIATRHWSRADTEPRHWSRLSLFWRDCCYARNHYLTKLFGHLPNFFMFGVIGFRFNLYSFPFSRVLSSSMDSTLREMLLFLQMAAKNCTTLK